MYDISKYVRWKRKKATDATCAGETHNTGGIGEPQEKAIRKLREGNTWEIERERCKYFYGFGETQKPP